MILRIQYGETYHLHSSLGGLVNCIYGTKCKEVFAKSMLKLLSLKEVSLKMSERQSGKDSKGKDKEDSTHV